MSPTAIGPKTERRVRVPGAELHVTEAGDGPPVVLLHGWPQHGDMWQPLIGELAKGHRVIVPDLRGFGRSEAPAGDYSKHALAADIVALLDREGTGRATIIGHDWGGWIAWLLALEYPHRVERFVSLDTPPPWGVASSLSRIPVQLIFGSYQYLIASPWLGERLVSSPKVLHKFIRAISGDRLKWSDEELETYSRPLSEPARARASVALYRTFLLHELPAIARGTYTGAELRVPGLVIMGGKSMVTKAFGAPPPRPGLKVTQIPEAGHFLVDEVPEQVLARLRGFLG